MVLPRFSRRNALIAGGAIAAIAAIVGASIFLRQGRAVAPAAHRGANVLLITLDTTRADRIGAYGWAGAETPHLDSLAREGILFENSITPSAYTLPSHASIMTGWYPPYHGVRLNGDAALADVHTTLAEQLSEAGYRTAAFVGAFVLDDRWGLGQGFDHYDDQFQLEPDQALDLAGVQRPANEVVDAALGWLENDDAKPFFAWVHLYDPHTPYDPPEPYRSRFAGGGPGRAYDGEIAFADSQVGRLLESLRSRGLDRNTIVLVVGDHGEGLGSHGESEHGYFVYDYAVRVPLILRLPGREAAGTRVAEQVRTIDVAPTLLELIGSEPPEPVHGTSLLPFLDAKPAELPRYAYSESMSIHLQYGWAPLYSIRTNEYKFIEAPRSELYDLSGDPAESRNRYEDLRRISLQMRRELTRIREESAEGAPEVEVANLDEETVRMLASLGYVGGASIKGAAPLDESLADPKDKIHLYESVGFAAHLMTEKDYDQATEVLEIVLADDANIPQAQLLLASAYRKTGQTARAKSILDEYLKKDPANPRALIAMAEILSAEGKRDEVLAICRRALAEDERNARAYELMADVYIAENDHAAALPMLEKAVEIQPKLTRSRNNLAATLIGLGRLDDAERLLGEIIRDHPKFPLANFHLGLLREEQGRPAEAREAYETEVENQPGSVVARFNLGNLLLRGGDPAGAEREMRAIIEEEPASGRAYLLLARVLLLRPDRLPEVETMARRGLERSSEPELKALGWFLLADVYSRQGRAAERDQAAAEGRRYQAMIRRAG